MDTTGMFLDQSPFHPANTCRGHNLHRTMERKHQKRLNIFQPHKSYSRSSWSIRLRSKMSPGHSHHKNLSKVLLGRWNIFPKGNSCTRLAWTPRDLRRRCLQGTQCNLLLPRLQTALRRCQLGNLHRWSETESPTRSKMYPSGNLDMWCSNLQYPIPKICHDHNSNMSLLRLLPTRWNICQLRMLDTGHESQPPPPRKRYREGNSGKSRSKSRRCLPSKSPSGKTGKHLR